MGKTTKATTFSVYPGRILFALVTLALFGAWLAQLTGSKILGFVRQHPF